MLHGALEQRRLRNENAYLRSQLQARYRFEGLIGQSRVMRELFERAGDRGGDDEHDSDRPARPAPARSWWRAPSTTTARAATSASSPSTAARCRRRCSRPSCSATCAAPSPAPSASASGRFELAHSGTLFLDEIGDAARRCRPSCCACCRSASSSASANRSRRASTSGSSPPPTPTSRRWCSEGTFREDLFYRAERDPGRLPPLRERREDIPLLVQHFLRSHRPRQRSAAHRRVSFSQEAMRRLMAYDWPGNVRELENVDRARARARAPAARRSTSRRCPTSPGARRRRKPARRCPTRASTSKRTSAARARPDPPVARAHRRQQRQAAASSASSGRRWSRS